MASVNFSPKGTQLDNDKIADIQVNEGNRFNTSFELDTSGLDANLQSFGVKVNQDLAEVDFTAIRTDFDQTTFPDFNLVETSTNDNFSSAVFERNGSPGAEPDTINIIVEGEAALESLTNDGQIDLGVVVTQATDANGTDVTELFVPSQQGIDLQLPQVQEIFGTEKSDLIFGTPQNDIIRGKEGNDSIGDNEGNDESFGGEGNDLFVDGAGNDTVRGGAGNDFFVGVAPGIAGDDLIDLGTGNDFALGGKGADTFVLNRDSGTILIRDFTPGEDRFALGDNLTKHNLSFARLDNDSSFNGGTSISDADTGELIAFADSATVEAVSNAEFVSVEDVFSTNNSPTTVGESNQPIQVESLPAQSGEIFGTPNPDLLVGDDGTNIIIAGNEGNDEGDVINSGGGDDLVFGEAGNDVLNGEAGKDVLNGGADSDVLNGDNNADTLLGEGGNDVISGGQGDDLLLGGDGNDALFGDEGHDTFVFASAEGADIIFDFEPGQDAIALTTALGYDFLQIEYNAKGNYTNISEETGEPIATLIGVEADQLTECDFTTI